MMDTILIVHNDNCGQIIPSDILAHSLGVSVRGPLKNFQLIYEYEFPPCICMGLLIQSARRTITIYKRINNTYV